MVNCSYNVSDAQWLHVAIRAAVQCLHGMIMNVGYSFDGQLVDGLDK